MNAQKTAIALLVVGLISAGTMSARGPAGFSGLRWQTPRGWAGAGTRPQDYKVSIADDSALGGRASAHIRGTTSDTNDFGTLMQSISAAQYRGRRVSFSGDLRISPASRGVGLWLRADDACGRVLTFGSSQRPGDGGTPTLQRHGVVLDVPANAQNLHFGTLLVGSAEAWISELELAVVEDTVGLTAGPFHTADCSTPAVGALPGTSPVNLDFTRR